MITRKTVAGLTVDELRSQTYMYGVSIKSIDRGGVAIPVLAKTKLMAGDTLTLVGLASEVNTAAPRLGYVDRPKTASDLILVGLGIVIGCLIGVLTIHAGNIPVSISTSGGTLISGLIFGWLRSKRPSFGRIPKGSRMDHEQSWPEHVYRRNRHHIRAIIRQRNQGSGLPDCFWQA